MPCQMELTLLACIHVGAKNVPHKSPQRQFCDAITFNAKSIEECGPEMLLETKEINIHKQERHYH
jgi:hypothetical protein